MTGDTNMAWNVLILAATLFQSVVKIQSDIVFPNSGKIEVGNSSRYLNYILIIAIIMLVI